MSRTITPQELKARLESVTVLDVRRKSDHDADPEMIPRAAWRDPEKVDDWSNAIPADEEVVIYCVRGGSVSNTVLDRLLAKDIRARYVEGGILGWKAAGGETERE